MLKNRTIIFFVRFLVAVFLFGSANAAETNVATSDQAELSLLAGSYKDNKIQLGLRVNMQPGWHIYWREPGDTGFPPVPDWKGSTNIEGIEFLWPAPKRIRQELQPDNFAESYTYSDNVVFPITLTTKDSSKPTDISLNISYAICAETCIPGEADLNLNLQPEFKSPENLKIIEDARNLVPQVNGTYGLKIENVSKGSFENEDKQFIEVNASNIINFSKDTNIFIEGGEHFSFTNPVVTISGKTAKFIIPVTFLTNKNDFSGSTLKITLINGDNSVELAEIGEQLGVSEPINSLKSATYSLSTLLLMIVFGFVGGLILNVMPCVLPILSIKILGVIRHGGGKKSDVITSFLMTALGIMVSFIGFAFITIWLKATGEIVGWGFHFQQPYFIITLVLILTLFAANLWGLFEISLPGHFSNLSSTTEGMAGHFMSGVLATILATPCTAPFLGSAVGFSITRGAFEIIVIFIAMGLGLAFPYLLFSLFPTLVTKLPKAGKWMLQVKQIMGILLALAAIWLIWVLSNQLGIFAAIALLVLCMAKILKLWAANHFAIIKKIKIPLLVFTIILSFIVPIKISNNFEHFSQQSSPEIWEEFKPEYIGELVAGGRIVFVDITADWCLTCKVNKLTVLDRNEIKDAFTKNAVVAMKADWTNHDNHIAEYLMKYERVGIPFNIVFGPGAPKGVLLSELLSKKEVLAALEKAAGR